MVGLNLSVLKQCVYTKGKYFCYYVGPNFLKALREIGLEAVNILRNRLDCRNDLHIHGVGFSRGPMVFFFMEQNHRGKINDISISSLLGYEYKIIGGILLVCPSLAPGNSHLLCHVCRVWIAR